MRIPGIRLREEYLDPSYVEQEVRKRKNWLLKNGSIFLLSATLSEPSIFWILAGLEAKVVIVPIHPASTEEEIRKYADILGDIVLLSETVFLENKSRIVTPNKHPGIAAILFSSGSTGLPKAIAITEKNLMASAKAHATQHAVEASDVWLLSLPLFHIGGFSVISRAYYLHQDIALAPRFDVDAAEYWLGSGLVNGVSLVPTMLWRLLEKNPKLNVRVKTILIGGSAITENIRTKALRLNLPIKVSYGLTESCSQVFSDWASLDSPLQYAGKASQGVEFKILDPGELCLRGEMISPGYWKNGAVESNRDDEGFLRTGDLATGTENGGISILGRVSELIISGGENIFPAEIESAMLTIDWITDAAVVGLPSEEWGQEVAAAIVLRDNSPQNPIEELKKNLLSKINPWKVPKKFLVVESVPRNAMKKIIRQKVLQLFLS